MTYLPDLVRFRPDRPGTGTRSILTAGLLIWMPLIAACGSEPPGDPETELAQRRTEAPVPGTPVDPDPDLEPARDEPTQVFDRQFLFLSTEMPGLPEEPDSLVVVPWAFRTHVDPDSVRHTQSVAVARDGEWDVLAEEARTTPPTRSPWRIVPGRRIRIVVGPGDRVESLLLRDPSRELETTVGVLLSEWERPEGVSMALYEATTLFPSGSVEGVLLDLRRRWIEGSTNEPGEWLFAYGGTDLQLFLREIPPTIAVPDSARFRGWARLAFRDLPQDDVSLTWTEMRPFEPARRDIPVAWSFSSPDSVLSGELRSVSALLDAGDGEGPILPVRGYFSVSGTVRLEGETFDVVGLVRHIRR